MIIEIAGKELHIKSILGPVGVRGINSKNKLILNKLGCRSIQTLKKGLQETYFWIEKQIKKKPWG